MNKTISWKNARLSELPLQIIDGDRSARYPKRSEFRDSGVLFLNTTNIADDRLNLADAVYVSEEKFAEIKKGRAKRGDVLMTTRGSIGKVALFDGVCETALINAQMLILRADSEQLDGRFLFNCLRGPLFKSSLTNFASGSAQPQIPITDLRQVEISVPPLATQRRIASILSAYDDLIENCEQRIRVLHEMARTLFREWFVLFRYPGHEKTPIVDSSGGPIPRGWLTGSFTNFADVMSGGTPKTDVPGFWNGEIPFFTPRDAPTCFYVSDTDKHLTAAGLSKCASKLYPVDTVFITARGTVGKVALPAVPMAMNQSCYALTAGKGLTQRYLFLLVLHQVEYLKKNTGGSTFDTIVVDTFRRMHVAVAPRELIARFTAIVDPLFDAIQKLDARVRNLRRTRDLLLPRLISGQLSVEDAA